MVTHLLRTSLDPSRIWQGREFLPPGFRKHVLFRWEGCWDWTGKVHADGYGIGPHNKPAHIWSYEKHYGKAPRDMTIAITCGNPLCVCPMHLCLKSPRSVRQVV